MVFVKTNLSCDISTSIYNIRVFHNMTDYTKKIQMSTTGKQVIVLCCPIENKTLISPATILHVYNDMKKKRTNNKQTTLII